MTIGAGPLSSLAFCWRIERHDGAGLGLTSHDCDLDIGDVTYRSAPGVLPSAIEQASGLDGASGEVEGALTSQALAEDELIAGRWDAARVTLFAVDWTDATGEQVDLTRGELGELSFDGDRFSADLLGAAARLKAPVCPQTSAQC